MAYIMKHFVRAIEYKLWLLLWYLAMSLAAHLVAGTVVATYITAPWWLVSLAVMAFVVMDILLVKGLQILGILYQQIPRQPIELLVCHFIVAFACVLLFLVGYTAFPWHGVGIMPDGFTWLVALNILSLGLYTTALSVALLSALGLLTVTKDYWPRIASIIGVAVAAYLLAFHVGPGIFTLGQLVFSPPAELTPCGEVIISDYVLHAPWDVVATNIAHMSFLLIFQVGILNYVLTDRVDVG